jgi:DNA primase
MTDANYDNQELKNAVCTQLNNNLISFAEAMQYLEDRGISQEIVDKAGIGFCPPYYNHYQNKQLILSPLMKGRITLPIRDAYGKIIAFAGRKFDKLEQNVELAFWNMYPNSPSEAQARIDQWKRGKWINESFPKKFHLFNLYLAKQMMREKNYVFLVEGYFDSLTLNSFGLMNNVALCGTRLTDWHAAKLARYCHTAVALLDGDEAGRKALEHMAPTLEEVGMDLKIISLPEGYDPDTYLLKNGSKKILASIELMMRENRDEEIYEVCL